MDPRTELILDVIAHDVRRYVEKQKELVQALQAELSGRARDSTVERLRAYCRLVAEICRDHEKCIEIMRYRYGHKDDIAFSEAKIVVLLLFGRQINRTIEAGRQVLEMLEDSETWYDNVWFVMSVASEFYEVVQKYLEVGDQTSKAMPGNFYLSRLLGKISDRYAGSFTPGNRSLVLETRATVHARKDQIHYVFSELITNAIKYEAKDRDLQIRIYDDADASSETHRRIVFSDTGPGMAVKKEEVFGSGIQASEIVAGDPRVPSRPRLGLKICEKLILDNEGAIDFKSDDTGTRFFIDLPKQKRGNNFVPGGPTNPQQPKDESQ